MPTYDYECDACGHTWELFQNITADPETKCPECKKKKARRLFGTGAAIMFKGSGFYETDYRSESYKKGAKDAKSKSESTDSGKSETKSESKPKSESKSENKSNGSKKDSGSSSNKKKSD